MDSYPNQDDFDTYLEYFNVSFFLFFVLELILKLSAYGFKQYFKDGFNWFDSTVVLMSAIDVILSYTNISNIISI